MRLTLETLARAILPRPPAGDFLAPSERRTLAAAAEVLLEGTIVETAPETVVRNVERFLTVRESKRAWRVRVLLTVVEYAPLLSLDGRFSRIAPAARAKLMRERFMHGRYVWALCGKIKPLVMVGAYSTPEAAEKIGFIPVPQRARYQKKPSTAPVAPVKNGQNGQSAKRDPGMSAR